MASEITVVANAHLGYLSYSLKQFDIILSFVRFVKDTVQNLNISYMLAQSEQQHLAGNLHRLQLF